MNTCHQIHLYLLENLNDVLTKCFIFLVDKNLFFIFVRTNTTPQCYFPCKEDTCQIGKNAKTCRSNTTIRYLVKVNQWWMVEYNKQDFKHTAPNSKMSFLNHLASTVNNRFSKIRVIWITSIHCILIVFPLSFEFLLYI